MCGAEGPWQQGRTLRGAPAHPTPLLPPDTSMPRCAAGLPLTLALEQHTSSGRLLSTRTMSASRPCRSRQLICREPAAAAEPGGETQRGPSLHRYSPRLWHVPRSHLTAKNTLQTQQGLQLPLLPRPPGNRDTQHTPTPATHGAHSACAARLHSSARHSGRAHHVPPCHT